MAKDFIIAIFLSVVLSAMIALSGCQSNGLPLGKKMETGEITTPPHGWIEWEKTKPNNLIN